jgi:death-on-curing protein
LTAPAWLTRRQLETLHEHVLRIGGGEPGTLRPEGLEGALGRPRMAWRLGRRDLLALAATYGHGIALAHPFLDGNKRTAYMAMLAFLLLNQRALDPAPDDAVEAMVAVAQGEWDVDRLAAWLERQPRAH